MIRKVQCGHDQISILSIPVEAHCRMMNVIDSFFISIEKMKRQVRC